MRQQAFYPCCLHSGTDWSLLCRPVPGLADALAALGESRPYIQALAQRGSEYLAQELTVLKHRYNALQQENVCAVHKADACNSYW